MLASAQKQSSSTFVCTVQKWYCTDAATSQTSIQSTSDHYMLCRFGFQQALPQCRLLQCHQYMLDTCRIAVRQQLWCGWHARGWLLKLQHICHHICSGQSHHERRQFPICSIPNSQQCHTKYLPAKWATGGQFMSVVKPVYVQPHTGLLPV